MAPTHMPTAHACERLVKKGAATPACLTRNFTWGNSVQRTAPATRAYVRGEGEDNRRHTSLADRRGDDLARELDRLHQHRHLVVILFREQETRQRHEVRGLGFVVHGEKDAQWR